MQYTQRGSNEHAATIYSQQGKDGKTFSYNGSFEGKSTTRSDFHEKEVPAGATAVGFIHTHDAQDNFSEHPKGFDENINRTLDRDVMAERTDKDYYLLNDNRDLIVNRRLPGNSTSDDRGGIERDRTLVSNINRPGFVMTIHLPAWVGPSGQPLKSGEIPPFVDAYYKSRKK